MKLAFLAEQLGATLHGDEHCEIRGVASIASAQSGDLTFLMGGQYRQYLDKTKASAVVLTEVDLANCPCDAIVVKEPQLAFAKLLPLFEKKPKIKPGIHSSAVIGSGCAIPGSVSIGPGCVIGSDVCIGEHAVISAHTVIGDRVIIGDHFYAYPKVTLYQDVVIGNQVVLHSGVVIGADGFGLANDQGKWVKIPQIGSVSIGDKVEVGANTTIDRGALDDTIIEEGVKIDNQVQVAHNVKIGAHTVVAGCVGIAGSAEIGRHCMIGGGACINGHIRIVDGVIITGMAMVMHSVEAPGIYSSGTGLQTNRDWRKSAVRFQQLDTIVKRLQILEREKDV